MGFVGLKVGFRFCSLVRSSEKYLGGGGRGWNLFENGTKISAMDGRDSGA